MSSTEAPARKRSRPSLRDIDELSAEPSSTPLSSVKKPKLSAPDPSPAAATPSSFLQRLNQRWFGSDNGSTKVGQTSPGGLLGASWSAARKIPPMAAVTKRKYTKKAPTSKPTMGQTTGSGEEDEPTQSKKRGRPTKRAMLNQAKSLARKAARERLEAAADENEDDEIQQKGNQETLTPVKRKRGRPRKIVAFENGDNEGGSTLGFKDLPPSAKKSQEGKGTTRPRKTKGEKSIYDFDSSESDEETQAGGKSTLSRPKSTPHPKKAVLTKTSKGSSDVDVDTESEEESEDDEVCEICGDAESEEPNLIIYCETCPLAVHQECYDIPVVPEGDWFCKKCQLETHDDLVPPISNELVGETEPTELVNNLPDIEGSDKYLTVIQKLVLSRLTGEKRINLRGHDEEMQKVHQLVEQTVLAGEGNSMLVIGARGSGKTTLVESVISDLSLEHRENFHVIRLNGFVHTDDKLALREIWRQLGREMEVEDDVTGKPSNHADTLASLLALLSHPSEISGDQTGQTAKSVIFVLDEFDLFTTHPRQTLLYNLFDIAQARKAPIAVLGLTARVDVVEALEKRVKSRFSHRYVHLSLPRSLPAFWETCKDGLLVDADEFKSQTDTSLNNQDEFLSCWQTMVENLYDNDAVFKHYLQAHFYRTKSAPEFFTSCILPITSLSPSSFPLTGRSFTSTKISLSAPDSKLHILQGLSDLELALLISAARLDIILDTDTCNFAMAYDEYSSLTSRHKIQTSSTGVAALGASAKVWGRDVALSAWERLSEYDLLVPASMGGGAREAGVGGRMWKVDIGLEEIPGSVQSLSTVMTKWCREI